MSDNYLRLIPTDPGFAPAGVVAGLARERLAQLVPEADEVTAETTDSVQFIDQGENFDSVSCPGCGHVLDISWWQDRMNEAYEIRFSELGVTSPCCGMRTSLNDLTYDWPAGFARFLLQALNPYSPDLPEAALAELSEILGTPLRRILARY